MSNKDEMHALEDYVKTLTHQNQEILNEIEGFTKCNEKIIEQLNINDRKVSDMKHTMEDQLHKSEVKVIMNTTSKQNQSPSRMFTSNI